MLLVLQNKKIKVYEKAVKEAGEAEKKAEEKVKTLKTALSDAQKEMDGVNAQIETEAAKPKTEYE